MYVGTSMIFLGNPYCGVARLLRSKRVWHVRTRRVSPFTVYRKSQYIARAKHGKDRYIARISTSNGPRMNLIGGYARFHYLLLDCSRLHD